MKTKKELMALELDKYLKADKKEKGIILDSLERQTGMWRESIIRSLKNLQIKSVLTPLKKRGRRVYYTHDVCYALEEVWKAANSCCGELLHPIISEYVEIFQRDNTWKHNDEVTGKLLAMGMPTVKRKVSGWKCVLGRKGISTTTPSAIKEGVPLFQGNWREVPVGVGQIDTVAHCGGTLSGDFMYSCGYVDVSSGWISYTVQWNKGMEATKESLENTRVTVPFPLKHVHPDCGSEFLNEIVMSWCKKNSIDISRSRSYHKNDNGYVEQRNGHISRRWLGYDRLGSFKLLPRVKEFYTMICLYHNHFIAQRLCIGSKTLPNGKYRKVYEKIAMTPYKRLLSNSNVTEDVKDKLKTEHQKLNPKVLHEKLTKMKCDILRANRLQTGELLH